MELQYPDKAIVTTKDTSYVAKWTMLYDQGFIIETNDLRFFSNFKYTLKEDWATPDQLRRIEVNSYDAFESRCGETMVGLVQLRNQPG